MRALWVVGIGATLGSCTEQQKLDALCNKTFRAFCQHQVECGIHYDQLACEEEESAELICNPAATEGQYDACFRVFDSLTCDSSGAGACVDILCDRELGCKEVGDICRTTTENGEQVPVDCPE